MADGQLPVGVCEPWVREPGFGVCEPWVREPGFGVCEPWVREHTEEP